jgi:hypothetical protein
MVAVVLVLTLLVGFSPRPLLASDATDLAAPGGGENTTPNFAAYTGRPEAINCLDMGSQANAQAMLRADPSDPLQLDSDRNGIACEINPGPRDLSPVPR